MNIGETGQMVRAPMLADWLLGRGEGSATTARLAELLGVPDDQVRRRLHAPARRGEWVSPAHGLWIPVSPEYRIAGGPPGMEITDMVMRHMGVEYYVGWLSAAEIYGAAHQAPQVFQVATSRHIRARQVGRIRFEFVTRAVLSEIPVTALPTRSGSARVSTVEATMLDVAANVDLAGGIHNAATVIVELSEADGFDLDALADQAGRFPASVVRRVGWILTKYADRDDLESLRTLARSGSPTPSLLDPAGSKTGAVNADWNLRINREVEADL